MRWWVRFQVFPWNCLYKNYPIVLNYTWNDYNGLVWGQEANPVGYKSGYIREGYALKKPSRTEVQETEKENWMFCKVYKENQKELEKGTTSIVCASYESDLQLK